MKICKKCNKQFKVREIIDGIERIMSGRTYCLECSPFMEKKGYLLRKENTQKKNKNKHTKQCPICDRIFKITKNNVCSTCRAAHRRYINKKELIIYKGGCCERCGCADYRCLQFHHIKDKKFILSGALHKGIEALKREVDKCILLCANCHQIEHCVDHSKILNYYDI